jgi:uncharacterized protein
MMRVSALHVYPVKSLAGIALQRVALTDRGFRLDRRWMVVTPNDEFVTQREFPQMATVWVEETATGIELAHDSMDEPLDIPFVPKPGAFSLGSNPNPMVTVWSSAVRAQHVSSQADEWLSQCLGLRVKLVYMPDDSHRKCSDKYAKNGEIVSFADGYPFLLTNEASLADLNARVEKNGRAKGNLPMSRFRPNLVVSGADKAWAEDDWKELRVGSHLFRVVKPCARCQVTTTDQASGEVRGPEPLVTLGEFRDSNLGVLFGQNLTCVDVSGTINVGDEVEVLR